MHPHCCSATCYLCGSSSTWQRYRRPQGVGWRVEWTWWGMWSSSATTSEWRVWGARITCTVVHLVAAHAYPDVCSAKCHHIASCPQKQPHARLAPVAPAKRVCQLGTYLRYTVTAVNIMQGFDPERKHEQCCSGVLVCVTTGRLYVHTRRPCLRSAASGSSCCTTASPSAPW